MQKPASLSAMISAFYRAHHATHDEPRIFDDTRARALFTDAEYADLGRNLALALPVFAPDQAASGPDEATAIALVARAQGGPVVLSRARYTEQCLEEAVRQGVRQYVILGAGMDTFAYREAAWKRDLRVFEVDHPDTQAFKRRRVAELGWAEAAPVRFVPVDFTRDSLGDALKAAGFDPQAPTFFSWLGVTYYLDREVVSGMLRTLAGLAPAGSSILFDYLDAEAFDAERATPTMQVLHHVMRRTGEPLKTGFGPGEVEGDLAALGWRLEESLRPQDIQERFFEGRTDGYRALGHYHFAWARLSRP